MLAILKEKERRLSGSTTLRSFQEGSSRKNASAIKTLASFYRAQVSRRTKIVSPTIVETSSGRRKTLSVYQKYKKFSSLKTVLYELRVTKLFSHRILTQFSNL